MATNTSNETWGRTSAAPASPMSTKIQPPRPRVRILAAPSAANAMVTSIQLSLPMLAGQYSKDGHNMTKRA